MTTKDRENMRMPDMVPETSLPRVREDLLNLVQKNGVCAEVGVFVGDFARMIYERCSPRKLHLIDEWETIEHYHSDGNGVPVDQVGWVEIHDLVIKSLGNLPGVEVNVGDSVSVLSQFPDSYFDFVYVDAAHSYGGCRADIDAATPKIKVGGLLGGHDLCPMAFPGVVLAVMETLVNGKWRPVAVTRGIFSSWLLRKVA